jgi:spore maturation protein CgeB
MLRDKKLKVIYELGPIFDEYRQLNCRARIGLNWSSQKDVCARVLEIMGMKRVPVINRVPDLEKMGLVENVHYYGFDGIRDACEKVDYVLAHPEEAQVVAENAYRKVVAEDTWDLRVEFLLKQCGLI